MMDSISIPKITADQAEELAAPMELDLIAFYRTVQDDFLLRSETFDGKPEELIEEIVKSLH